MKRLANLAKLCRTIMTKRERMASAAIVQTETVGNLPLELLIGFSNIHALTGILFRCQYICSRWCVWKYSVTAQPMQWIWTIWRQKIRKLGQIHVVGVDDSPEMVGGLPWMVAVRCWIHVVGCRPLLLRQPLPLQPPSVGKNHLAKPLPDHYVTFRFSKNMLFYNFFGFA